jgi:glycopeptide antibiotics resistance protein
MNRKTKTRLIVRIALTVYFLLLLKLILFKNVDYLFFGNYSKYYGLHSLRLSWGRANFIPFRTLYYYFSLQEKFETGLENIGGNIVLFIPYGFLLPVAFSSCARFNRSLLVIVFSSLFFETCQLFLAYGNFDVDDIILNTIGGLIGYLLFRWVYKIVTS